MNTPSSLLASCDLGVGCRLVVDVAASFVRENFRLQLVRLHVQGFNAVRRRVYGVPNGSSLSPAASGIRGGNRRVQRRFSIHVRRSEVEGSSKMMEVDFLNAAT